MPNYDSDSSGGEDGDFTTTGTLLGYSSKEPTDDTISQLGGHPSWLDGKTAPSGALAKCKACNGLLTLLLQLNGDLPERFPGHERRLYILSCRNRACRRKEGSIRGVRGSRVTKVKGQPQKAAAPAPKIAETPQANIGAALFGGANQPSALSNPFSTNPQSSSNANPFSTSTSANPFAGTVSIAAKSPQRPDTTAKDLPETFASKARISESSTPADPSFKQSSTAPPRPHEPWPPESEFPPPYPKSYLDADYETLSAPSTPKLPHANVDVDADMGGTSSAGGGEDKELYESTMDKTFQKFADRMEQNPEQILRYEYDGQPLLYSATDAVGKLLAPAAASSGKVSTVSNGGSKIPRCTNCGTERVCEVQLTPHAITVLEEEEAGLEGMEWGTIILGVCKKDCSASGTADGEVGYLEEWVGVQWEETTDWRKK